MECDGQRRRYRAQQRTAGRSRRRRSARPLCVRAHADNGKARPMIRPMRAFAAACAVALLVFTFDGARASRPVDQGHFTLDPAMGYILVRVGPVSGRGGVQPVYLVRLNPDKPGTTMWAFGQSNIDSRRQLDAAMISGHDHWGTDGTTSLFLVPV